MTVRELYEYAIEHDVADVPIAVASYGDFGYDDELLYLQMQGLVKIVDDRLTRFYPNTAEDSFEAIWLVCADCGCYEEA